MSRQDAGEMVSEDLVRIPAKRARSPDLDLAPSPVTSSAKLGPAADDEDNRHEGRQPKRLRRNKDVPEYDAKPDQHVLERMGRSNPMNRKNLKKDAKRARRAAQLKAREEAGEGKGMAVDDQDLEFTFMA